MSDGYLSINEYRRLEYPPPPPTPPPDNVCDPDDPFYWIAPLVLCGMFAVPMWWFLLIQIGRALGT